MKAQELLRSAGDSAAALRRERLSDGGRDNGATVGALDHRGDPVTLENVSPGAQLSDDSIEPARDSLDPKLQSPNAIGQFGVARGADPDRGDEPP